MRAPIQKKSSFFLGLWALALFLTTRVGAEAPEAKPAPKGGSDSESVIYSPIGKRDPFRPPTTTIERNLAASNPLEKYSVDQLQLKAILKKDGTSHAMLIDPDLRSHIITDGDVIGREHATVSKILQKSVILTERTYNYLGEENLFEKFLYLPQDDSENGDGGIMAEVAGSGRPQGDKQPAPSDGNKSAAAAMNPYTKALIDRLNGLNAPPPTLPAGGPAPASVSAPVNAPASAPTGQPSAPPEPGSGGFGSSSHVGGQPNQSAAFGIPASTSAPVSGGGRQ